MSAPVSPSPSTWPWPSGAARDRRGGKGTQRRGSDVERLSLFPTPLAVSVLPSCKDLKPALSALILACYQEAAEASGDASEFIRYPWQGAFVSTAEAGEGLTALAEAAVTLTNPMADARDHQWDVTWRAEVLHPGQGFDVRGIPDALWCACYLIDAGGPGSSGGALELQDPRGAATVMYAPGLTFAAQGAETLGVSQSIGLKEGALAVFPAWLLQSISLHQGRNARLSVTLRLQPRTPKIR